MAYRKLDFLIPLVWQCSLIDPCRTLYAELAERERAQPALWSLSFTPGFPPADIREVGPAVLAYADDQDAADAGADALAELVSGVEADFAGKIYTPDGAVLYGIAGAARPLVIADSQDNPGAGGNSDTVVMLRALVRHGAERAVFGLLYDPEAAALAHAAGEGAEINLKLGARSSWQGEQPFEGTFTVVRLGDGAFTATGPMFGGARMKLGPMAVLRIGGIEVVVASKKMQAGDQAMFRHVGIEPAERDILVLKSSVHFRADFADIAGEIIVAGAPGPNEADQLKLPYRNLRPGLRLIPQGPEFKPGRVPAD